MPRRCRICPANIPVHVVQRGNNRQICFTNDKDAAAYANWLMEGAIKYDVQIHAWVFMTNHVHLLLTPHTQDSISHLMQYIGRQYVRYFNYSYARSGTLFEGRYKSSVVQEAEYLITCLRYIELNPVRAGLVTEPGEYRWSSYSAHGLGKKVRMWTPHPLYLSLGPDAESRRKTYRKLISHSLDLDVIATVRHCANKGLILGTEKFRQQFEHLSGDGAR